MSIAANSPRRGPASPYRVSSRVRSRAICATRISLWAKKSERSRFWQITRVAELPEMQDHFRLLQDLSALEKQVLV